MLVSEALDILLIQAMEDNYETALQKCEELNRVPKADENLIEFDSSAFDNSQCCSVVGPKALIRNQIQSGIWDKTLRDKWKIQK